MTIGHNTRSCLLLTSQRTATTNEVASLLRRSGVRTSICPVSEGFAGALAGEDCRLVLLDASDGDATTLDMLAAVRRVRPDVPVLVLVRQGDVTAAVRAMKAGATDCIEIPAQVRRLCETIDRLCWQTDRNCLTSNARLTQMERVVLRHVLEGCTTREIAKALNRSPRTIDVHRRRFMHKLHVSNIASLMKQAIHAGLISQADGHRVRRDRSDRGCADL